MLSSKAIDSVETYLLKQRSNKVPGFLPKKKDLDAAPDGEDPIKQEIETGTHKLETLLNTSIDKAFDIFELYVMKNIITVSADDQPHMRLAHYADLDFDAVPASPDLPSSTNTLRRRLQASQRVHAALEAERLRNAALLEKLRAAVGAASGAAVKKEESSADAPQDNVLGFLRDRGRLAQGGSEAPVTLTTEFALSQLPRLRALSGDLRGMLPHLDDDRDPDAPKSGRGERAEYVEAATRRYLEKEGGLELGVGGELRDGEWQGGGGSLRKEEVEELEKVMSILGPGAKATDDNEMHDS